MALTEHHKGTAQAVALVTLLVEQAPGFLTVAAIAERLGLHHNTARAALAELVQHGWAEHHTETDRFTAGPALPRLGLTFQDRLLAHSEDLRRRWDAALPTRTNS